MFGRLWRYFKALFNRKMDTLEDPEILLDQARRDMNESHNRNRERAIQAITQKNNLQAMVDKEISETKRLERLAETALKSGNRELARTLLRDKMTHDSTLVQLQTSLTQAQGAVEQVKSAIQQEEDKIREKTADALRLKAQWKQAQIQNEIQKSLSSLNFEDSTQGFGAAEEKIRNMQSESSARAEMYGTTVQSKVAALESTTHDMEADEELKKMEERLGLASPPPAIQDSAATAAISPSEVDIEKQLAELEAKSSPPETKP